MDRLYRSKYSDRQRLNAGNAVTSDMVNDLYRELAVTHYSEHFPVPRTGGGFGTPRASLSALLSGGDAFNVRAVPRHRRGQNADLGNSNVGTYAEHQSLLSFYNKIELSAQAKYGGVLGQRVAKKARLGREKSVQVQPYSVLKDAGINSIRWEHTNFAPGRNQKNRQAYHTFIRLAEGRTHLLNKHAYTDKQFKEKRSQFKKEFKSRYESGTLDHKTELYPFGPQVAQIGKLKNATRKNIDNQINKLQSNESQLNKIVGDVNNFDNVGDSKKYYVDRLEKNRQRQNRLKKISSVLKSHGIDSVKSDTSSVGYFGAGGNVRTNTHAATLGSISRLNAALPEIETAIVGARQRGRNHKVTTHLAKYNENPKQFHMDWKENKKNKRGPTSLDEEINFIKSKKYADKDLQHDELNRLKEKRNTNLGLQGLLSKHASGQKRGEKHGMDMSYTKDLDLITNFQNKRVSRPKGYTKALQSARTVHGRHDYDPSTAGFFSKGGKINLKNYDEIRKSEKKIRHGRSLIQQRIKGAKKIHIARQKAHKTALKDLGVDNGMTDDWVDPHIKKQHNLELSYLKNQDKIEATVEKDILNAKKSAEFDIVSNTSIPPATILPRTPQTRSNSPNAPRGSRGTKSNHYNLQIPRFGGRRPRQKSKRSRQISPFGF